MKSLEKLNEKGFTEKPTEIGQVVDFDPSSLVAYKPHCSPYTIAFEHIYHSLHQLEVFPCYPQHCIMS